MNKTVILTKEQIKKTLNVEFVNCSQFNNTFYKYMSLSRVLQMLENRKMAFIYPELWNDPYEIKYLNTDFSKYGYHQDKLYCLCVRNDNLNQEASWKIYKEPQEPLIRLSINAIKLMQNVASFSKKNNAKVYFSKIDYSLKTKEIDELYKSDSPFYGRYIEGMNELKYIKLMSLKRNAFSYENERRIFLVVDKRAFIDNILNVDIDLDIFKRFTINPCDRIKNNDIKSSIKSATYKAINSVISKAIKKFYPEAVIKISPLYKSTEVVSCIE